MKNIEIIIKRIEEFCRREETEAVELAVKLMINNQYPVWDKGAGIAYSFLRNYHSSGVLSQSVKEFKKDRNDDNARKVTESFQEYLDMCRILGISPTPNQFFEFGSTGIEISPFLIPVLTDDQKKEYIFTFMVIQQGNGRFVPINASPSTYRERYNRFTNSRFSLDENLLFSLVENINIDNSYFAGAAPILYDPILRDAYPGDTQKLAELYRDKMLDEIRDSPITWKVEQDKEIVGKLSSIFDL